MSNIGDIIKVEGKLVRVVGLDKKFVTVDDMGKKTTYPLRKEKECEIHIRN